MSDDLRIGRYSASVTEDAGAAWAMTFPDDWSLGEMTAVLGETDLPVDVAGQVVTVSVPAAVSSVMGRTQTWTLHQDGVPLIRGGVNPSASGSPHGDTTGETTVLVDDRQVTVQALGPPGPAGPIGGSFYIDSEGYVAALVPSLDDTLTLDDDGFVLLTIGD